MNFNHLIAYYKATDCYSMHIPISYTKLALMTAESDTLVTVLTMFFKTNIYLVINLLTIISRYSLEYENVPL